jgi:hypothetical protein
VFPVLLVILTLSLGCDDGRVAHDIADHGVTRGVAPIWRCRELDLEISVMKRSYWWYYREQWRCLISSGVDAWINKASLRICVCGGCVWQLKMFRLASVSSPLANHHFTGVEEYKNLIIGILSSSINELSFEKGN